METNVGTDLVPFGSRANENIDHRLSYTAWHCIIHSFIHIERTIFLILNSWTLISKLKCLNFVFMTPSDRSTFWIMKHAYIATLVYIFLSYFDEDRYCYYRTRPRLTSKTFSRAPYTSCKFRRWHNSVLQDWRVKSQPFSWIQPTTPMVSTEKLVWEVLSWEIYPIKRFFGMESRNGTNIF